MSIAIKVGEVLTNHEMMEKFKIANSGGMRRSLKTNSLVLIHNTIDSIYNDRWDNNELLYTGMGLKGDQDLDFAQNKTLANSKTNGVEIYLFEVKTAKKYTFIGKVKLSREPYYEKQKDEDNRERQVIIFPIKLVE